MSQQQQMQMMQHQRMQQMQMMRPNQMEMGPNNGMGPMGGPGGPHPHMRGQMTPQQIQMMQMQQQQQHSQQQMQHQQNMHMQNQNRQPPPKYNEMMGPHVRNPNYMMNQMAHNMGPGPPGAMRFGGPGGPPMGQPGPRMGPRGQGFQSIPPSGPMMRQQAAPPNMMGNGPGPGDMQRMRLPPNHMMGPGVPGVGVPNGPQKVPVSHPSPQHAAAGSPAGMWANMGSGSPNPNGMPMQQQQSIGSPRTPGILFGLFLLKFF